MRSAALDDALAAVAPIVADVRARGDAALLEWTQRFDGARPDGIRLEAAPCQENQSGIDHQGDHAKTQNPSHRIDVFR